MKLALRSVACVLLLLAAGCEATLSVDGYPAAYVDAPVGYDRHPHYMHGSAHVYEIDGRYYRQHNNRWVVYRERPRDLRRDDHR